MKTKEMCKEATTENEASKLEVADYSYYSKLLQKPFDSLEDLKKAEDEYNKTHALELKAKQEKSELAKKIEDAYKEYLHTIEESNKKINEARKVYLDLRSEFIDKYHSYHQSYYKDNNREIQSVSDVFDEALKVFNKVFW